MKAKARKFRGYAPVRAERGFGPRHGANAKEGDLTKIPSDTVPAMLTPREAVLNRNGAEMAGRGNIERLNAAGNELARKGVDLAGGTRMNDSKQKVKKLASGSGNVAVADPLAMYGSALGLGAPVGQGGSSGAGRVAPVARGGPLVDTSRPWGFAGGTDEVGGGPIGSANPDDIGWQPIQLSAPQLQMAAQKAGLSAGQIQGLMSAVQGVGGMGGGAGSASDMATAATAGYAGGISDIGYPPFAAPEAVFHADKGGWLGPYDPAYTFNSYARGIASVPALRSAERAVVPFR